MSHRVSVRPLAPRPWEIVDGREGRSDMSQGRAYRRPRRDDARLGPRRMSTSSYRRVGRGRSHLVAGLWETRDACTERTAAQRASWAQTTEHVHRCARSSARPCREIGPCSAKVWPGRGQSEVGRRRVRRSSSRAASPNPAADSEVDLALDLSAPARSVWRRYMAWPKSMLSEGSVLMVRGLYVPRTPCVAALRPPPTRGCRPVLLPRVESQGDEDVRLAPPKTVVQSAVAGRTKV